MELKTSKSNKLLGGIYKIINITNNRVYIGSTSRFGQRFNEHNKFFRDNKNSPFLQNDYNKCGPDAFKFEILEIVNGTKQERLEREQYYLNQFFDNQINCYNINAITSSRCGSKNNWTEEDRRKCSEERKARWKNPEYRAKMKKIAKEKYEQNKEKIDKILQKARDNKKGTKLSDKTKKKLSESQKGRTSYNKGKHLSEKTKQKLSISHQKTYNINLLSPDGRIFGPITNLLAFCKEHNLKQCSVWCLINGKQKSTKGWKIFD